MWSKSEFTPLLLAEDDDIMIEPLSTPPPLPDAMRQENAVTDNAS
jgi:hypothetical protein